MYLNLRFIRLNQLVYSWIDSITTLDNVCYTCNTCTCIRHTLTHIAKYIIHFNENVLDIFKVLSHHSLNLKTN